MCDVMNFATVFMSVWIVVWHVWREGGELSRCVSVYELNLFGRCMKSMQLGGTEGMEE